MKVTKQPSNKKAFNAKHRKENKFTRSYLVISKKLEEAIELRIYETDATTYACVWINSGYTRMGYSGYAKGYGYDRVSSAAYDALVNAGYEFDASWAGYGERNTENALLAIAKMEGHKGCKVFKTHG